MSVVKMLPKQQGPVLLSASPVQCGSENSDCISVQSNHSAAGNDFKKGIFSRGKSLTGRNMPNEVSTIRAVPRDYSDHRL
jgi:hypothetical protein